MRKKIAAGNWKMNTDLVQAQALTSEIAGMYRDETSRNVRVILAPPFPFLSAVHHLVQHQPEFTVAAQNLHPAEKGAFTGEVSAEMILSTGARAVIIGHSERRQYFSETDAVVAAKTDRALAAGLEPIVCVGESLEQREAGHTFAVLEAQCRQGLFHLSAEAASKIILAYEPVWAIGTGKTASPEQAQEVHAFLRGLLEKQYGAALAQSVSILYGGSVTAATAPALFSQPDIDGGLVGGASLKSREFVDIIRSFPKN